MNVPFPNIEVKAIYGFNPEGYNNNDVLIVEFNHQKISYLPSGISKFFPNAETFKVHSSGLLALDRRSFLGLFDIKELSFYNNWISEIPEDTFNDLVKMESLSLSQNWIVKLEDKVFLKLINIREIYSRNNRIESISSKLFKTNLKLRVVWLQNNRLINIAPNTFAHFPEFHELKLTNNYCIDQNFVDINSESKFELENIFKTKCSHTCQGLTSNLTFYIRELSKCEDEFEKISRENIKIKNHEKICLIL